MQEMTAIKIQNTSFLP